MVTELHLHLVEIAQSILHKINVSELTEGIAMHYIRIQERRGIVEI
jgi:hypothetical protein